MCAARGPAVSSWGLEDPRDAASQKGSMVPLSLVCQGRSSTCTSVQFQVPQGRLGRRGWLLGTEPSSGHHQSVSAPRLPQACLPPTPPEAGPGSQQQGWPSTACLDSGACPQSPRFPFVLDTDWNHPPLMSPDPGPRVLINQPFLAPDLTPLSANLALPPTTPSGS